MNQPNKQIFALVWFDDEFDETEWRAGFIAKNIEQLIEEVVFNGRIENPDHTEVRLVYSCHLTSEAHKQSLIDMTTSYDYGVVDITENEVQGLKAENANEQRFVKDLLKGFSDIKSY